MDWKRLRGQKNALRTVAELNGCSEQEARRVIDGWAGAARAEKTGEGGGVKTPPYETLYKECRAGSGAPWTEPPTEGSRNKAKRERLGAESLAEIDRLVQRGDLCALDIAERVGCKVEAVRRRSMALGVYLPRSPYGAQLADGLRKRACFTTEEKRAAVQRTLAGETREHVAKSLGVSRQTVSNWKREFGMTCAVRHSPQDRQAMLEAVRQGAMCCEKIAAQTGYSMASVWKAAAELGVKLPPNPNSSQRQREKLRGEAVRRVLAGEKRQAVAESLGVNSGTLTWWLYITRKAEREALRNDGA